MRCWCIVYTVACILFLGATPDVAAFAGVRYVRLGATNDLVLNEVQIFPCSSSANVALNKPTSASAFGGVCSGTLASRAPSIAVDGITSCSGGFSNTFCSSIAGDEYWEVDLQAVYEICTIAILQSTTSTTANALVLRGNAGNTLYTRALTTGHYAIQLSCTSSSCSASSVSCTSCNTGTCSNHASAATGSFPACTCTCTGSYTGAYCQTSTLCTNADDCNGRASSVSGSVGSCTCTCNPEWTGTSCQTSNVCTSAVDCSNHASSVSGNRPSCTCTCTPAWTGTSCETSNACTSIADCNNRATGVSGNRPTCLCTCQPAWTGTSCQTSNVCTNSGDCNSRASTVSGNRPSCTCNCSLGYVGVACATRVCAAALDCNATGTRAVHGTFPACFCNCRLGFGGAVCGRVLTDSVSLSPSHSMSGTSSASVFGGTASQSLSYRPTPSRTVSPSGSPRSISNLSSVSESASLRNATIAVSADVVRASLLYAADVAVVVRIDGVEFLPTSLLPTHVEVGDGSVLPCVYYSIASNVSSNATRTYLERYLRYNVSLQVNMVNQTHEDVFAHTALATFAADAWFRSLREGVWIRAHVNPLCLRRREVALSALILIQQRPDDPIQSVSDVTTGVVAVSGVVGGMISPSVAIQASRSLFDLSLASCSIEDDDVSVLESPLQLRLGSSAAAMHVGVVVGNAALLCGLVGAQLLLAGGCLACGLCAGLGEALALVRLPSWTSFPVLMLLQPTATSCVISVIVAEPEWKAVSVVVLLCLCGSIAYVAVRTRVGFDAHYTVDKRSQPVEGQIESPGARALRSLRVFLYGTGKWKGGAGGAPAEAVGVFDECVEMEAMNQSLMPSEGTDAGRLARQPTEESAEEGEKGGVGEIFLATHVFLDQHRLLFNDYNGANRDFMCYDASLSLLVGFVGGLKPAVPNCVALAAIIMVLFAGFLALVLVKLPYMSTFLLGFTVVMTVGQSTSALLTMVYVSAPSETVMWALDAVTWVSSVLAYLLLVRVLTDAVPKAFVLARKFRALVRSRQRRESAGHTLRVENATGGEAMVPLVDVVAGRGSNRGSSPLILDHVSAGSARSIEVPDGSFSFRDGASVSQSLIIQLPDVCPPPTAGIESPCERSSSSEVQPLGAVERRATSDGRRVCFDIDEEIQQKHLIDEAEPGQPNVFDDVRDREVDDYESMMRRLGAVSDDVTEDASGIGAENVVVDEPLRAAEGVSAINRATMDVTCQESISADEEDGGMHSLVDKGITVEYVSGADDA